ncbi:RidA family protein [Kribbella sp. NPDC058693]|uniref:RidA family protein n=1 Tax=Kribbella jiaozuonensis TaxID=2575441 RepID=A0A4U3LQ81_9ACTN|nr:RidA family protein [Kribbella jiaozuonensis]TKK78035.1 RidA family protein [Kribbella jiaozuonensis]
MSDLAIEPLNPSILPMSGKYSHGVQVDGAQRMVFVSGQVPWGNEHGRVPETFEAQCRMVWRNVLAVLSEAGMGIRNLVKVTTYLSDRQYRALNAKIREEVLGDHAPALTVVIADIYAENWLLEIEAVAMA